MRQGQTTDGVGRRIGSHRISSRRGTNVRSRRCRITPAQLCERGVFCEYCPLGISNIHRRGGCMYADGISHTSRYAGGWDACGSKQHLSAFQLHQPLAAFRWGEFFFVPFALCALLSLSLYLQPFVERSLEMRAAGSLRDVLSGRVRYPCGTAQLIEIKPTM